MATGKLGAANVGAANTTVYTVPASTIATFNISVCNRSSSPITFRLAIAESATPGNEDWIEYDTSLGSNTSFERTGIVAGAGLLVVAYASSTNASVVVWGYEETA
jgi:hypothetical protein